MRMGRGTRKGRGERIQRVACRAPAFAGAAGCSVRVAPREFARRARSRRAAAPCPSAVPRPRPPPQSPPVARPPGCSPPALPTPHTAHHTLHSTTRQLGYQAIQLFCSYLHSHTLRWLHSSRFISVYILDEFPFPEMRAMNEGTRCYSKWKEDRK